MYSVQENVLHQLKATCNKAILVPAPLAKNLVNFLYVYSWLVCVFILSFLSIVKYPLDIFFFWGGGLPFWGEVGKFVPKTSSLQSKHRSNQLDSSTFFRRF